MEIKPNITIRSAAPSDLPFIQGLLPSYAEFGLPPWRDADVMVKTDAEVFVTALQNGATIFIAEDQAQTPLGFIHLHPGSDHYFKGKQCHISDLIVAPAGRGQGVGKVLMAKAEEWATREGYERLTLNVFAGNERAEIVRGTGVWGGCGEVCEGDLKERPRMPKGTKQRIVNV